MPRSYSREVRIRVPVFSVVYFSRGTLPQKREKRALLGDLVALTSCCMAWDPELASGWPKGRHFLHGFHVEQGRGSPFYSRPPICWHVPLQVRKPAKLLGSLLGSQEWHPKRHMEVHRPVLTNNSSWKGPRRLHES